MKKTTNNENTKMRLKARTLYTVKKQRLDDAIETFANMPVPAPLAMTDDEYTVERRKASVTTFVTCIPYETAYTTLASTDIVGRINGKQWEQLYSQNGNNATLAVIKNIEKVYNKEDSANDIYNLLGDNRDKWVLAYIDDTFRLIVLSDKLNHTLWHIVRNQGYQMHEKHARFNGGTLEKCDCTEHTIDDMINRSNFADFWREYTATLSNKNIAMLYDICTMIIQKYERQTYAIKQRDIADKYGVNVKTVKYHMVKFQNSAKEYFRNLSDACERSNHGCTTYTIEQHVIGANWNDDMRAHKRFDSDNLDAIKVYTGTGKKRATIGKKRLAIVHTDYVPATTTGRKRAEYNPCEMEHAIETFRGYANFDGGHGVSDNEYKTYVIEVDRIKK